MADAIELTEHNDQRENETAGSGSGSLAIQEVNRSYVRLRRAPRDVGYSVSSPKWATCPPEQWTKVQDVASVIVALNVTTLQVLQDGWFGPTQIINRCDDRYKRFLTQDEIELVDQIPQDGGVFFSRRCEEYVQGQNREQTMSFLTDTKTSDFYPLLVDVAIKLAVAAAAHRAVAEKLTELTIPEAYEWCETYQNYVGWLNIYEREKFAHIKYILGTAQRFLSAVKSVVEDETLDDTVLIILQSKVSALNEHYRDATLGFSGESFAHQHLFDPTRKDWWNSETYKIPSQQSEQPPAAAVKAYDDSTHSSTPTLNFFVPAILLLSCIPMAVAWIHSPWELGKSTDGNLYQLTSSSLIQTLSSATLLFPTLFNSKFSGHAWLWTWILAIFSVLCTVLSVSLYCVVPLAWSMVISFGGTVAQTLIILQIVHAI